jgi:hypothetical protein
MGSTYQYTPCLPCCNQCNSCPNGVSQCWGFTTTGNSDANYNGTFCLVQSKTNACVFTDGCTNHWTLTLNGGATTLATDNGTVYILSESLNCTGLNSFALATSGGPTGSTWQPSMTINPTNCANYPCAPNCTAPPCSGLCPNGIAQCWLINVSGATLTNYNGTFCLVQQPGPSCSFSDVCSNLYSMKITGATVVITASGDTPSGAAIWTWNGANFQCNGTNTFTLSSQANNQQQWPATVSITPTNCANQPCYPNCPPPPTCNHCSNAGQTIAKCWSVAVSGVTNQAGECICNAYNTTFFLQSSVSAPCEFVSCDWGAIPQVTLSAGNSLWTLSFGVATYTIPLAQFNCNAPNTLALSEIVEDECLTWPATLTIMPSNNCPVCDCACSSPPASYTVTISGVTPAPPASFCGDINGTYTMTSGAGNQIGGSCSWNIAIQNPFAGVEFITVTLNISNGATGRAIGLYAVMGFPNTSQYDFIWGITDCSNGFATNPCAASYTLAFQGASAPCAAPATVTVHT